MRVFDLHCDTIGEMYDRGIGFDSETLDVNSRSIAGYDDYVQVTAIWSRMDLDDQACYDRFLAAIEYAKNNLPADFRHIYAVEDARLLCGDISRLAVLRDLGVKILTLAWAGLNGVSGAHDTDYGLFPFGREVVAKCFEYGIVPDVSHASDDAFEEVIELARAAGKPVIASHSSNRMVCYHPRNLTDKMYLEVASTGGVTGVCLEPDHLGGNVDAPTAAAHIMRYFKLDPHAVCLGCDFDGRSESSPGLDDAGCLRTIASELAFSGLNESQIDDVLYANAARFFDKAGIEY